MLSQGSLKRKRKAGSQSAHLWERFQLALTMEGTMIQGISEASKNWKEKKKKERKWTHP